MASQHNSPGGGASEAAGRGRGRVGPPPCTWTRARTGRDGSTPPGAAQPPVQAPRHDLEDQTIADAGGAGCAVDRPQVDPHRPRLLATLRQHTRPLTRTHVREATTSPTGLSADRAAEPVVVHRTSVSVTTHVEGQRADRGTSIGSVPGTRPAVSSVRRPRALSARPRPVVPGTRASGSALSGSVVVRSWCARRPWRPRPDTPGRASRDRTSRGRTCVAAPGGVVACGGASGVVGGGVASGGVALGGVALGGVALGGVALGGVALGGVALGGVALGGVVAGGCPVPFELDPALVARPGRIRLSGDRPGGRLSSKVIRRSSLRCGLSGEVIPGVVRGGRSSCSGPGRRARR